MIVLLDLNYTLVANSQVKRHPFIRQIAGEQYRTWLADLLLELPVILVTARPEKYREATLASILAKTGWRPGAAFFNDVFLPPAAFKRLVMGRRVFPKWGEDPAGYLAIESNPNTRAMYAKLGVRAVQVGEDPWTTLPV